MASATAAASGALPDGVLPSGMDEATFGTHVAQYLLARGLHLTALELHQELFERAEHQPVLDAFFHDEATFPRLRPDDLFTGTDTVPDAEQRVAVLEYELRIAREDIEELRAGTPGASAAFSVPRLARPTAAAAAAATRGETSDAASVSSAAAASTPSTPADAIPTNDASTATERRALNCLLKRYLLDQNYRLSAITLSDEASEHDLDNMSAAGLDASLTLLHVFRSYFKFSDRREAMRQQERLHQSMTECRLLEERLHKAADELAALKSQLSHSRANETQLTQQIERMRADAARAAERSSTLRAPGEPTHRRSQSTSSGSGSGTAAAAAAAAASQPAASGMTSPGTAPSTNSTSDLPVDLAERPGATLSAEGLRVVNDVATAVPIVTSNVLFPKRETLMPLFCAVIRSHPQAELRSDTAALVFSCLRQPEAPQRRVIIEALTRLAHDIGPRRFEAEVLSKLVSEPSAKFVERRQLAAELCAALAPLISEHARVTVMLDVLQSLSTDESPAVREIVSSAVASLVSSCERAVGYERARDILFALVYDAVPTVSDSALGCLLAAFAEYCVRHHLLFSGLLQHILDEMAHHCQDENAPREGPFTVLAGTLSQLSAMLFTAITDDLLPAHRARIAADDERMTALNTVLSSVDDFSSYSSLFWLIESGLPNLVRIATLVPINRRHMQRDLQRMVLEIGRRFGPQFADVLLRHSFERAFAALDDTPAGREQRSRLLFVYTSAVLGRLDLERLEVVLRELVTNVALQEYGWTSAHAPVLADSVKLLAQVSVPIRDLVLRLLVDLVGHPASSVRSIVVALCRSLVTILEAVVMAKRILPCLQQLGADPEPAIRKRSVAACCDVVVNLSDVGVLSQIRSLFEEYLASRSHEITSEVIRCFAEIIPSCHATFRDDFILPKVFAVTSTVSTTASTTLKVELCKLLLDCYRAAAECHLPHENLVSHVIPGLHALAQVAEPIMDTAFLDLMHALSKDFEQIVAAEAATHPADAPDSKAHRGGLKLPKIKLPKIRIGTLRKHKDDAPASGQPQ